MPVDEIKYKGKRLKYSDYDAIPFGFDKDLNEKVGVPGTTHRSNGISIEYDKYSGRLWKDSKIITFWNYPDVNTMKILLKKLESNLDIDFSDWLLEVWINKKGEHEISFSYGKIVSQGIKSKLIPISEYVGSEDSPEEIKINHLKTIEEKEREKQQKIKDGTFIPYHKFKGKVPHAKKYYSTLRKFTESAEYVDYDNQILNYYDKNAYPFIISDEIIFGNESLSHISTGYRYEEKDPKGEGRIWIDYKIIAFWYIETSNFVNTLKDIQKSFYDTHKIKIDFFDGEWKINVHHDDQIDSIQYFLSDILDYYEGDHNYIIPLNDYLKIFHVVDIEEDKERRKLHLLDAKRKQEELKKMGYKSKTKETSKLPPVAYRDKISKYHFTENFNDFNKLNESPIVKFKGELYWWSDIENYAFSYYFDEFFIKKNEYHYNLCRNNLSEEDFERALDINSQGRGVLSGRLFPTLQVITFWDFPKNKFELKKLALDIKKQTDIDILDGYWYYEDVKGFILSIDEYEFAKYDYYRRKYMFQENFNNFLNESPDIVYDGDKKIGFWEEKFITFLYHEGQFYYDNFLTHPRLLNKISGKYFTSKESRQKLSGRLFLESKIITFWLFPDDKKELKKVADDIKKHIGIDIWTDEWRIEINSGEEYYNWEGNSKIIPIKDYVGSAERSEEELKMKHTDDPQEKERKRQLLKQQGKDVKGYFKSKYNVPAKFDYYRRKHVFQENFNNFLKLNENPNEIHNQWWQYTKCITFSYYFGKFYTGKHTHLNLWNKIKYDLDISDTERDFYTNVYGRGELSGRLFLGFKVITFWEFPKDNKELKKVADDIKKHTGIDIWTDEWKIEILVKQTELGINWEGETDFIPVKEYTGSKQRSEEELKMKHTDDPQEKERKRQLLKQQGKDVKGYFKSKYNVPAKFDYYRRKHVFQEKFDEFSKSLFNVEIDGISMNMYFIVKSESPLEIDLYFKNNKYDELSIILPDSDELSSNEFFMNPKIDENIIEVLIDQNFIEKTDKTTMAGDVLTNAYIYLKF